MPDETLYLYTSLTAGSSHIITATSRLETILKANKIPFRALDCATDEKARQLWGRRSKGRKLPGLVKYGQVVGVCHLTDRIIAQLTNFSQDMEQIEEWNEFGELEDQVSSVSDIFSDTPMTDTPMAAPVNTLPPNPLRPFGDRPSQPSSRASSEGRHISISDPRDNKRDDNTTASSGGAAKGLGDNTPLAMAMRQAGAEAAAKAGQKKTSSTTAGKLSAAEPQGASTETPSSPITPPKSDPSSTTPNPASLKSSIDAAIDPTGAPTPDATVSTAAATAAKTPAQLTAEGSVRAGSVDKQSSLGSEDTTDTIDTLSPNTAMSNEEQLLDRRRQSSLVKTTSRLGNETSIDDITTEEEAAAQAVKNVEAEKKEEGSKNAPSSTGTTHPTRLHRGSSITEVPKDIAEQIEAENAIKEEPEEEDEEDEDEEAKPSAGKKVASTTSSSNPGIQTTDKLEEKATKGKKPQDGTAAKADEAGQSVGD